MRWVQALSLVACLACVNRSRKPHTPPRPLPDGHIVGTICGVRPRADGGCSVLSDPYDWNGACPEVEILYPKDGRRSPSANATLRDLATEMRRIPRLTTVALVSAGVESAEIKKLVDELVGRGVERERLVSDHDALQWETPWVRFEPIDCDGVRIRDRSFQ